MSGMIVRLGSTATQFQVDRPQCTDRNTLIKGATLPQFPIAVWVKTFKPALMCSFCKQPAYHVIPQSSEELHEQLGNSHLIQTHERIVCAGIGRLIE